MSLLTNTVEGAALVAAGAVTSYLLLTLKNRRCRKAAATEAEALLEKARKESEMTARDARLAASEEALKLREEVEKSFAARREERADLERRLSERERLINSQLERMVEAEKGLQEQKTALTQRAEALEGQERELTML